MICFCKKMKIFDGLKLKGLPVHIPNSSREELPMLFKNMGFKVGAEIGVYRGEFTKLFAELGIKMYAIDPWIAYLGAGRSENKDDMQDTNFEYAKETLSPFPDCTLIRKTSQDALVDIPDESLDFVYIDGDHRFRFIAEDIVEWSKKVKKGGIISGHDYFNTSPNANNVICHVKAVVDTYVKSYKIENFYTFGQTEPIETAKKNDRTLSWMWKKT